MASFLLDQTFTSAELSDDIIISKGFSIQVDAQAFDGTFEVQWRLRDDMPSETIASVATGESFAFLQRGIQESFGIYKFGVVSFTGGSLRVVVRGDANV